MNVRYIVVHGAWTPPSLDVGAAEICEWHRERGWQEIGYHWVIRRDGTVEDGRDHGTPGAHVRGHNHHSVGICLIGGKAQDADAWEVNYTTEQYSALRELLRDLTRRYEGAEVVGHRDLDARECPGFDVLPWWSDPT